jgi:nicotinate-nucleotide adenylyltransferase
MEPPAGAPVKADLWRPGRRSAGSYTPAVQARPPRIGVFGGTFDPPHLGHLVIAVNVRFELDLDRVLFVVANEPWQKVGDRQISPAADRLALVEAAVADVEGLEASRMEIDRGGPSFSADTLAELHATEPGAELFLVLGRDAALAVPTWERADELDPLATMVVVDRPGADGAPLPAGFRWVRVEAPRLEVSSTDLRARVSEGRPLDFLVPDAVVSCIERRGLYREPRDG